MSKKLTYIFIIMYSVTTLGCEDYKTMELKYKCGAEGYFDFALMRCGHYLSRTSTSDLSTNGQFFVLNVKRCLIQKINQKKIVCDNLWTESIEEHSVCFLENKYCELSFRDKLELAMITGIPSRRFDIFLKTSYSVGKICL
jgi:hypothetical protein